MSYSTVMMVNDHSCANVNYGFIMLVLDAFLCESGQECEITAMIIECCSQERTYLRYYGLLAQRFALMSQAYRLLFEENFTFQYSIIHRLETNKLRNVAKLSAHLLATDAISWSILSCIRLTEEDTTSSARIFIKILFQVGAFIS